MSANTSAAMSAAASSSTVGMARERVFGVIEMVACPRLSETTLGWMPARSAHSGPSRSAIPEQADH